MSDTIEIIADGDAMRVEPGITLASALLNGERYQFRQSTSGTARGPLCGMGICHECRVTIDGVAHQRACMVVVAPGMRVDTGAER
jgi:aerobic-type carbon monoxide dehydrogenase small subunit (CoxS/CutS family)